jgi:hypothetical protein
MTAISSVAGSGYSCSTALDTSDDLTKKYMVLAAYDPAIHDVSASNTQVLDRTAPTSRATRILLPSASGGYKSYSRKIWTCAPPAVLDLSSKTCKIKDSQHACDNGSGSGVPSPVSPNMSGSTSKDQFDNAANRKLACCLNSYDRRNPMNPVKYDCIQNADQNPLDFDKLWISKDPDEAGGQGNAIVLTDGGGRPVTGFFSLSGARCAAYSELAAPIRVAAVNPIQVAGQQTLSGGQTDPNKITFSGEIIGPPPSAPSWFASNRSVPDLAPKAAQEMRNCPVLARAAIVATCGDGNSSGKLPQQFTDSKGNVRCLAAQSVKVHLRIQQVYTITGMAPMKTIDTVVDLEDAKRSSMNLEGMIRARAGTFCPVGASYVDGNCIFK